MQNQANVCICEVPFVSKDETEHHCLHCHKLLRVEQEKLQQAAGIIVASIERNFGTHTVREIAAIGLKGTYYDNETLNAIQDEAKRLEADYGPETERNT